MTAAVRQAGVQGGQDEALLASAIRKNTWRLVPLLGLAYLFNYLDRTSVGFAALQMNKAIGLTATQFGWGAGILFFSYCLLEVPSNMMMYRFGARRWLARIMITWDLAAAATAFVTGPHSFYAIRFLLGVFEAGFFPGVIWYISIWFPEKHRTSVLALFMAATPLSSLLGSPISAASSAWTDFGDLQAGDGCFSSKDFRPAFSESCAWFCSPTRLSKLAGSRRRNDRRSSALSPATSTT